jgi:hypothetical protein
MGSRERSTTRRLRGDAA